MAFANGDPDGTTLCQLTRLAKAPESKQLFHLTTRQRKRRESPRRLSGHRSLSSKRRTVTIKLDLVRDQTITRDLTNPMGLSRVSPGPLHRGLDLRQIRTPTSAKSMVCVPVRDQHHLEDGYLAGPTNLPAGIGLRAIDADGVGYLFSHFAECQDSALACDGPSV